jgi:hypothetical protein
VDNIELRILRYFKAIKVKITNLNLIKLGFARKIWPKRLYKIDSSSFTVGEKLIAKPPSSPEQMYDLVNEKYHILLATGAISGTRLTQHSTRCPFLFL